MESHPADGALVGDARVCARGRSLDTQLDDLRERGVERRSLPEYPNLDGERQRRAAAAS